MSKPFTYILIASVLFICTGGAFASFDDCGQCGNVSEFSCNRWTLDFPCHRWDQAPNDHDRGDDPHMYGGDFEVGNGACLESHGVCEGGGEEELLAAIDFPAVVQSGDHSVLDALAERGFWMEVNEERSAIQVLGYCSETGSEYVVTNIPVSQEKLSLWIAATS